MKRFFQHRTLSCGTRTVAVAALICLAFASVSCRTIKTIEVPVPIHDTTYVVHNVHDSVFVENTTTEYIKGDTVFINKTKTKYIEKTKVDTLVKYVEKPIEITNTEYVEVEKKLSWMQKSLMVMGVCFALSVIVGLSVFLIGLKKK